jgi:hypothetical protein
VSVLDVYLWGWVIFTAVVSLIAAIANPSSTPPLAVRAPLALLAGALWPILAVGVLQACSIMLVARKIAAPAPAPTIAELIPTH